MKTFRTICGKEFTIDDGDYLVAMEREWKTNDKGYVYASVNGRKILLHHVLTNAPDGSIVDHIDGNPSNNCKNNLRICTARQNTINRAANHPYKYKGVRRTKRNGKFMAYIKIDKVQQTLGVYDTKEEAALAYNEVAKALYGEFARLNVVE